MSEAKDKTFKFYVDGKEYETTDESITAAKIKQIAGVQAGYQLFLEGRGNEPDRAVADSESIDLKHGKSHFFSVPPATFGRCDK